MPLGSQAKRLQRHEGVWHFKAGTFAARVATPPPANRSGRAAHPARPAGGGSARRQNCVAAHCLYSWEVEPTGHVMYGETPHTDMAVACKWRSRGLLQAWHPTPCFPLSPGPVSPSCCPPPAPVLREKGWSVTYQKDEKMWMRSLGITNIPSFRVSSVSSFRSTSMPDVTEGRGNDTACTPGVRSRVQEPSGHRFAKVMRPALGQFPDLAMRLAAVAQAAHLLGAIADPPLPKMVYWLSRCGASPSRIEKLLVPESGSSNRPMLITPAVCLTSGCTSSGTFLAASVFRCVWGGAVNAGTG
jgi:hypothetical protein